MIKKLKWRIKAILEYTKFKKQYINSKILLNKDSTEVQLPTCFIAGCGRSGTTLLGKLLSFHKSICYLNEPRPKWAVINPKTDIWGYWNAPELEADLFFINSSKEEKTRFCKVFFEDEHILEREFLVEKSPENAFRLSWLSQLCPDAKFIHLLRNGADVISSILVESSFDIPYGFHDMNNWYGRNEIKRVLLLNTANKLNLPKEIINCCTNDADFAALEWICSIKSIEDYWPNIPKKDRITIRYEEILEEPVKVFGEVLDFLGLDIDNQLQMKVDEYVRAKIKPQKILNISSPLNKLLDGELVRYGYPPS